MNKDIDALNEEISRESKFVDQLFDEIGRVIVGQKYMVERLMIGLLCNGHVLLEGVPGLAKTLTIKTLSDTLNVNFQRIQFTPDLLPADLLGTMIYNPKTGEFFPHKGPIFTNIVLADEVNRAPPKVQSALLEAMQERQVTIGTQTYPLSDPFLVLATQNPIEQEGTYPLPEAQVDRFMLKLLVNYPERNEERQIMDRIVEGGNIEIRQIITPDQIVKARELVSRVYMDDKIKDYIVDLVIATREPERYGLNIKELVEYGASPRATISLAMASKAYAFIKRRGYVTPADVKAVGSDILRHRIILTYEAEAEEFTSDDIIKKIFDTIEVP